MAISRQNSTLTKLHALTAKATLTSANVQLAVDHWDNEEFPSKLERQVRTWMKANGNQARHAGLIAAYAKLDEKSASVLVDPVVAAQDAIIKLKDEDDIHLLVKRAINYTEISNRLWTMIVAYSESLSARTLKDLSEREDAPAKFVKEFGADIEEKPTRTSRRASAASTAAPTRRSADKPLSARAQRRLEAAEKAKRGRREDDEEKPARGRRATEADAKPSTRGRRGAQPVVEDADEADEKPTRRGSRKLVESKPTRRGRTGASTVVKPRIKAVPAEMDFEDDEKPTAKAKSNRPGVPGKTVNKGHKVEGAIAKIRKVVGPAKTTVRRVQVEDRMDATKVRAAAQTVRRPRV
jgi:hypothetical protein